MIRVKDRIIFRAKNKQKEFLNNVRKKSWLSNKRLAAILKISDRTFRDWLNGKYKMSYEAALFLSKKFRVCLPNYKKELRLEHLKKAGKKGGISHIKKYGRVKIDEEKRKEKWREWWEEKGRFEDHPLIGKVLPFKKPTKSEELAEFVGIVLGDGSISKRQITIYLHREDDKEYGKFVSCLAKKLFQVPVGIYQHKSSESTNYIISRTDLVRYFVKDLGLKIGNKVKQQVDIPRWIKQNRLFSQACVRGLFDTDGCFFDHRYRVGGKLYSYKKAAYTSRSIPLLKSVYKILEDNNIKARFTNTYDVRLDSKASMEGYMKIIGTSNTKHLKRYNK